MKNRILEMTKGCATVRPDLVATDAEAQSAAKASPVNMNPVLLSAICALMRKRKPNIIAFALFYKYIPIK
jgi:hypothetical protein